MSNSYVKDCVKNYKVITRENNGIDDVKRMLVMGNDFDLFHKLPTSYRDFIDIVNRMLELDANHKSYFEFFIDDR